VFSRRLTNAHVKLVVIPDGGDPPDLPRGGFSATPTNALIKETLVAVSHAAADERNSGR
jgi:hypothetical protein